MKPRESHRKATERPDGDRWEEKAAHWLHDRGLQPVAHQVRSRRGEIDLVMRDGNTAVIVEVRYRQHRTHGSATESIGHRKRQRIIRTALAWWVHSGQHHFTGLRFDTVTFDGNDAPVWTVNAFDAEGSI